MTAPVSSVPDELPADAADASQGATPAAPIPALPDRADAPVSEVAERFLRAVIAEVPLDRIEELHLFSPLRQGTVETGIAVLAARIPVVVVEPDPAAEPELFDASAATDTIPEAATEAPQAERDPGIEPAVEDVVEELVEEIAEAAAQDAAEDAAEVAAEVAAAPVEDTAAETAEDATGEIAGDAHVAGEHDAGLEGSVVAEELVAEAEAVGDAGDETVVATDADLPLGDDSIVIEVDVVAAQGDDEAEEVLATITADEAGVTVVSDEGDDDEDVSYADEAVAEASADEGDEAVAVEVVHTPPARPERLTVYTARYRYVIKGPERGKWEASVKAEADAPLITVETVVRGVQRRAGEDSEIVRYSAAQIARALRVPFPA